MHYSSATRVSDGFAAYTSKQILACAFYLKLFSQHIFFSVTTKVILSFPCPNVFPLFTFNIIDFFFALQVM